MSNRAALPPYLLSGNRRRPSALRRTPAAAASRVEYLAPRGHSWSTLLHLLLTQPLLHSSGSTRPTRMRASSRAAAPCALRTPAARRPAPYSSSSRFAQHNTGEFLVLYFFLRERTKVDLELGKFANLVICSNLGGAWPRLGEA